MTAHKESQLAVQENEERPRAIAGAVPVSLLITRLGDNTLVYTNHAALDMFGLSFEEFVKVPGSAYWADPRERDQMIGTMKREGRVRGVTAQLRLPSGEIHWAKGMSEPLTYEGEASVMGCFSDITEIKDAARLKDKFISTLSHELRTPLTSVMGSLGIISGLYRDQIPPDAAEMLDVSLRNTDMLVRLVNELLDLRKMESGKLDMDFKEFDLSDLLKHAVSVNRGFTSKYGVHLELRDEAPGTLISGDWVRLIQVLSNLISNAVKYSPRDGLVTVKMTREASRAVIAVSDQGRGIPKEFHGSIFDKFSQVDSSDSREKGGAGLGLSISKAIVEAHGVRSK